MHDMPMYEARCAGTTGSWPSSVKSGPSVPVPIIQLGAAAADGGPRPFAYSTHRNYSAPAGRVQRGRDHARTAPGLLHAQPQILPPHIAQWLTGVPATPPG